MELQSSLPEGAGKEMSESHTGAALMVSLLSADQAADDKAEPQ